MLDGGHCGIITDPQGEVSGNPIHFAELTELQAV